MSSTRPWTDPRHHLARVKRCARTWKGDPLPMATPPGERYPLVYPRDVALILRDLEGVQRAGALDEEGLLAFLRGAAGFLLVAQAPDRTWGQRYGLDGRDRSLYLQEDNTAHAASALARAVLAFRRRGDPLPEEGNALGAAVAGLEASWRRNHDPVLGLFASTTSVHESRMEEGFTLWTNGAHLDAARRVAAACQAAGDEPAAREWDARAAALGEALASRLVVDGRFVRRLDPGGRSDLRPDVTLFSPFLFGFDDLDPAAEAAGARTAVEGLWTDGLGLLERYPPDKDDLGIHLHGGVGPYLSFSSWFAQREAALGSAALARDVLDRILALATREGDLPEHAATLRDFEAFFREEVLTGLDLRKELDARVLARGVGIDAMVDEAARMMGAYGHAVQIAREEGDDVVRLAIPHAWTHAEVAYGLVLAGGGRAARGPGALATEGNA